MLCRGVDSFIEMGSKTVDVRHWAGENGDLAGQGSWLQNYGRVLYSPDQSV